MGRQHWRRCGSGAAATCLDHLAASIRNFVRGCHGAHCQLQQAAALLPTGALPVHQRGFARQEGPRPRPTWRYRRWMVPSGCAGRGASRRGAQQHIGACPVLFRRAAEPDGCEKRTSTVNMVFRGNALHSSYPAAEVAPFGPAAPAWPHRLPLLLPRRVLCQLWLTSCCEIEV